MNKPVIWTLAFLLATVPAASHADDFRNRTPWDFKVRRSTAATARAVTLWQVQQAANTQAATTSTSGTGSSGQTASTLSTADVVSDPLAAATGTGALAGVRTTANMNIITIVVGEGGTADVAIETEQSNTGRIGGRATAVSGGATIDLNATE